MSARAVRRVRAVTGETSVIAAVYGGASAIASTPPPQSEAGGGALSDRPISR
jgi:hypothetical protein